jgi:hypothetical protein
MNLKARIELIKQPEKIKDALYANSPTVLSFAFEEDPNVRALIGAGNEAIPLIEQEIKQNGSDLHEISLSCFAYILTKINVRAAAQILRTVFPKIAERPGSFAAMFVAYALRMEKDLPVGSWELFFTPDQLREMLRSIEQ